MTTIAMKKKMGSFPSLIFHCIRLSHWPCKSISVLSQWVCLLISTVYLINFWSKTLRSMVTAEELHDNWFIYYTYPIIIFFYIIMMFLCCRQYNISLEKSRVNFGPQWALMLLGLWIFRLNFMLKVYNLIQEHTHTAAPRCQMSHWLWKAEEWLLCLTHNYFLIILNLQWLSWRTEFYRYSQWPYQTVTLYHDCILFLSI